MVAFWVLEHSDSWSCCCLAINPNLKFIYKKVYLKKIQSCLKESKNNNLNQKSIHVKKRDAIHELKDHKLVIIMFKQRFDEMRLVRR